MAQRGKLRPRGLRCCSKATQAELILPFRLTSKAVVFWSRVGSCRKPLRVKRAKGLWRTSNSRSGKVEQDRVWGTVRPQCQPEGAGGVPGTDCSLEELLSGQSGQSLLACLAQSVARDRQRDRQAKADLANGTGKLRQTSTEPALGGCQPLSATPTPGSRAARHFMKGDPSSCLCGSHSQSPHSVD